MMTPDAFVRDYIKRWEDGCSSDPDKTHSLDPLDAGNWTGGKKNVGTLVGSNHGVTATALAAHRGVKATDITVKIMRALTLAEAATIAIDSYYSGPHLDYLPWNPVTASVLDFGWGAGPITAVKKLQRVVGVDDDGVIGRNGATVKAYTRWLSNRTLEQAADAWADLRIAYYEAVISRTPSNAKYRRGWRNRTTYFTKGDPEGWWERFMV